MYLKLLCLVLILINSLRCTSLHGYAFFHLTDPFSIINSYVCMIGRGYVYTKENTPHEESQLNEETYISSVFFYPSK